MALTMPYFKISGSYIAVVGEGVDAVRIVSHHGKQPVLEGKGPIFDKLHDTIFVTGHSSYNPIKGGGYYGVDPLCSFEVMDGVRYVSRVQQHALVEEQKPNIVRSSPAPRAEPGVIY